MKCKCNSCYKPSFSACTIRQKFPNWWPISSFHQCTPLFSPFRSLNGQCSYKNLNYAFWQFHLYFLGLTRAFVFKDGQADNLSHGFWACDKAVVLRSVQGCTRLSLIRTLDFFLHLFPFFNPVWSIFLINYRCVSSYSQLRPETLESGFESKTPGNETKTG